MKFLKRYSIEISSAAIVFAILLFMVFIVIPGSTKLQKWILGSTKIMYMQSIFQLGAATSIAFAVAGPQIRHALGPRIGITIQRLLAVNDNSSKLQENLAELIRTLKRYDKYKRNNIDYTKSTLYPLYLGVILLDIVLLFWSSLIDPNGSIPNVFAPTIILCCVVVPLADLFEAYRQARHIRPILQKAENAGVSGAPEEIETVCRMIVAEIKAYPKTY